MSGKILTPQDELVEKALQDVQPGGGPTLMVNVNGENTPWALAMLLVANEQANALTRIADTLEGLAETLNKPTPPRLESV